MNDAKATHRRMQEEDGRKMEEDEEGREVLEEAKRRAENIAKKKYGKKT